jgi:hypothetical protein
MTDRSFMAVQSPGQSDRFHLKKMRIDWAEPLRYFLSIDDASGAEPLYLNELIGAQLELHHSGEICCQACGNGTRKSYGQGHCYRCFKRLARCDLCVMAPHRCHYDKGTCREPAWGESFCMQPHLVYLANSSGLKVGITREGAQMGRFGDQGALQGRILAKADTRKAAGELEAELAKSIGDRSQWRALVSQNAPLIDLDEAAAKARALIPEPGGGVRYVESDEDTKAIALNYPVEQWPPVERLNFKKSDRVSGVLRGIKGQYLLFDTGVFNVREHTGFEVVLSWRTAEAVAHSASQTDLFEP